MAKRGEHGRHIKGSRHPKWRRSIVSSHGYVKIRVGKGHPFADPNGYAYEHIVVWRSAGRRIPRDGEVVYHKNGDTLDSRIENLAIGRKPIQVMRLYPNALTDNRVRALRRAYAAGQGDTAVLGKRFKIDQRRAWKIITGRTRRDAGGPIARRCSPCWPISGRRTAAGCSSIAAGR